MIGIAAYVLQVRKWRGLVAQRLGSIGIDVALPRLLVMRRRTT